ncbi:MULTISPECIES: hypothetical protein [unclassified Halorhabdus]|uniref:hypothetical protein n=1 Tax=unclassified Halorhabdus TaxID=2621901 RepID=UPI001E489E49|nr:MULTISPECIES: hypothetical protein [unclassified Halorhabdus]
MAFQVPERPHDLGADHPPRLVSHLRADGSHRRRLQQLRDVRGDRLLARDRVSLYDQVSPDEKDLDRRGER